ncbi:MAG: hypothetical protein KKA65_02980 [Nanoarchaeota archaeon]|nr:hypothetical protein [Nanoarchaeota archaeon]MBU4352083.1 hypothetical protein [Nanoarchaeota archaeon]MBU4456441.1 hypothetical protein [Nanoarchaeota archaeon]
MFKKILLLMVMSLVLVSSVNAVTIQGTIYDNTLNKLENVMLEIDSQPKQTLVSKDGSYSFEVSEGDYLLTAKYYENNFLKLEVEEEISVLDEGSFIVDLILFETLDDELLDLSNIDLEDSGLESSTNYIWLTILIIGLIMGLLLLKFFKKKPVKDIEDNDLEKIISIMKENGGRIKQRDLRKQFPLSEAKVSLMITELEHHGKIKKIKKGRGNILILQK